MSTGHLAYTLTFFLIAAITLLPTVNTALANAGNTTVNTSTANATGGEHYARGGYAMQGTNRISDETLADYAPVENAHETTLGEEVDRLTALVGQYQQQLDAAHAAARGLVEVLRNTRNPVTAEWALRTANAIADQIYVWTQGNEE